MQSFIMKTMLKNVKYSMEFFCIMQCIVFNSIFDSLYYVYNIGLYKAGLYLLCSKLYYLIFNGLTFFF